MEKEGLCSRFSPDAQPLSEPAPPPSPRTREQTIEEGKRRLEARLVPLCLLQIIMKDDGNCQYRAFARHLYGDQDLHYPVCKGALP